MVRLTLIAGVSALMAGCATTQPPLLEDDGQALDGVVEAGTVDAAGMVTIPAPGQGAAVAGRLIEAEAEDSAPAAPASAVAAAADAIAMAEQPEGPATAKARYPELQSPTGRPTLPQNMPEVTEVPAAGTTNPYFQPSVRQQTLQTPQGRIVGQAATAADRNAHGGAAMPAATEVPGVVNRPRAARDYQPTADAPSLSAPLPPLPEETARRAASRATAVQPADGMEMVAPSIQDAVDAVNRLRVQRSLPPLRYSEELSAVAAGHAAQMASRSEVTSKDADGHGIGVRLLEEGYAPVLASSLVAGGFATFDGALASWESNPQQASRLLMPSAEEIGIAIITDPASTHRYYIEAIIAAQ